MSTPEYYTGPVTPEQRKRFIDTSKGVIKKRGFYAERSQIPTAFLSSATSHAEISFLNNDGWKSLVFTIYDGPYRINEWRSTLSFDSESYMYTIEERKQSVKFYPVEGLPESPVVIDTLLTNMQNMVEAAESN